MRFLYLPFLILISSCNKDSTPLKTNNFGIEIQENQLFKVGSVFADNQFKGARLNDFSQIDDSTYQAIISPENEPINSSPWYAFKIWSETPMMINLDIKYTLHQHRYIPKLSTDGHNWTPLEAAKYQIDTSNKKVRLQLDLTQQVQWVAGQEIENSVSIYTWMDSLVNRYKLGKNSIGKTVLKKPIYSLELNSGPKPYLVLIGRQHPPEVPGGTLSFKAFLEECLSNKATAKEFRKQFNICALPLLNPDGVDLGHWRHNTNGVDLNRDWQAFSQPETQAARDYLKSKEIAFAIDFHTSFSGPYLLVLDSLSKKEVAGIIPQWIETIESNPSKLKVEQRPRSQELPYCYNWFINEFDVESVTYEEGDEIDRALIDKRARIYANSLMTILLEKFKDSSKD